MISYETKSNNANPIGKYTKKELIELEHKWRLKLKKNGFKDIEAWDNNPKAKIKRVKFIRSHVRYRNKDAKSYWMEGLEKSEYFRIIGLYAHHCKKCKYVEVLKDYSMTGNMSQSIRNTKSIYKQNTVSLYVRKNIGLMIKFTETLNDK